MSKWIEYDGGELNVYKWDSSKKECSEDFKRSENWVIIPKDAVYEGL